MAEQSVQFNSASPGLVRAGVPAASAEQLPALKVPPVASTLRPLSSPVSARSRSTRPGSVALSSAPTNLSSPTGQRPGAEFERPESAEIAGLGLEEDLAPLGVTKQPTRKVSIADDATGETPAAALSTAQPPVLGKQYSYARKAPPVSGPRVVLTKETMELEMKQMRSFNREVYEARVRQKFLEEALTRKLYVQNIAMRRQERLAEQRIRTDARVSKEFALRTPYLQSKAREAQAAAIAQAQSEQAEPFFSDLAAIEERLAAASVASRQITPESRVATLASVKELAVRAQSELPTTESLMNPRNQVTSPLPPKEVLLPSLPKAPSHYESGNIMEKGVARALLTMIPELFDAKRTADADAERRRESRPSLPVVVTAHLGRSYTADVVTEKLSALRLACAIHKSIPRVAIFQAMMGWGPDGLPWDSTKSAACLLLMMWLAPPQDEATKVRVLACAHCMHGFSLSLADFALPLLPSNRSRSSLLQRRSHSNSWRKRSASSSS